MRTVEALHADRLEQDLVRVIRADGTTDERRDPKLSETDALKLYRLMVLNRTLDERMTTLQRQGRIGFYIGSVGEEACILGSAYVLRAQDWLFPCYREHGATLLRGMPLVTFISNLFGNANDPIKGRQMPCHEAWRPGNFASISSPLGTQIPQAVGAAWAAKLKGDDMVALVYFGDGGTSTNDFHVGANFAGVFKAPVILFCRNNQWAISVPLSRQTASETIADKAVAYGIHGVRVDGNDLLACIAVTREAHERARRGDGATLVEAYTYRILGHSTSDDPRVYRKDEDVAPWRDKDPIAKMKRYLTTRRIWAEDRDLALHAEIEEEVKAATTKAEAFGPPAIESMFEEVYARPPWHLREERDEALSFGYFAGR
jgi:pyruvate dehydrogenase E1 component alpha subunit